MRRTSASDFDRFIYLDSWILTSSTIQLSLAGFEYRCGESVVENIHNGEVKLRMRWSQVADLPAARGIVPNLGIVLNCAMYEMNLQQSTTLLTHYLLSCTVSYLPITRLIRLNRLRYLDWGLTRTCDWWDDIQVARFFVIETTLQIFDDQSRSLW